VVVELFTLDGDERQGVNPDALREDGVAKE